MTQSIIELIKSRRSIRSYKPDKLTKTEIKTIVETGLYAPSANNTQNWQITVITNSEVIRQCSHLINEDNSKPDHDSLYGAPLLILVSTPRSYNYGEVDSAAVMENMLLAAHGIGIGSVWIGTFGPLCDTEDLRKLLDSIDFPSSHIIHTAGVFGYLSEDGQNRENKGKVIYID